MRRDDDYDTSGAGAVPEGPADEEADDDAGTGGRLREIFSTGSLTGGSVTGGTGSTGGLGTGAGDMSGGPFTGGDVMTGGDDGVDTTGYGGANEPDEPAGPDEPADDEADPR